MDKGKSQLVVVFAIAIVAVIGTSLAINAALGSHEPSTVKASSFRGAPSSLPLPGPPDSAGTEAIDSGADAKVEPDPDFEVALRLAGIRPGA